MPFGGPLAARAGTGPPGRLDRLRAVVACFPAEGLWAGEKRVARVRPPFRWTLQGVVATTGGGRGCGPRLPGLSNWEGHRREMAVRPTYCLMSVLFLLLAGLPAKALAP